MHGYCKEYYRNKKNLGLIFCSDCQEINSAISMNLLSRLLNKLNSNLFMLPNEGLTVQASSLIFFQKMFLLKIKNLCAFLPQSAELKPKWRIDCKMFEHCGATKLCMKLCFMTANVLTSNC